MRENLEIDGRLAVRGPMRWSRERHGGFTTGDRPCRPPLDDDPADVASQRRDPQSFLNWFERLIRRRKECPELGWGRFDLIHAGPPAVLAHRCDLDDATIVAVHNLGADEAEVELGLEGEALVDLFSEDEAGPGAPLTLEGYAHRWYRLRRRGQRIAL